MLRDLARPGIHDGVARRSYSRTVSDLLSLQTVRDQLAQLLASIDESIRLEEARLRLNPDEVLVRKLENAETLGRNMALAETFATPEDEAELRRFLGAEYGGNVALIERAVTGARSTWSSRRAS